MAEQKVVTVEDKAMFDRVQYALEGITDAFASQQWAKLHKCATILSDFAKKCVKEDYEEVFGR